jgi:hypothetical protein
MRIPFPKSIPFPALIAFLAVILLMQLVQGTDPVFALLMLVAQLAAAGAFNLMGGMTHMAGAFCLFSILPTVTVPELTHMALGQAGDYKLEHPLATAGACAVFYVSVLSAALLVSLTRPVEPYLDRIPFSILELRIVSALSAASSALITFLFLQHYGPPEDGSLLAAVGHFQPILLAVSVMLATYVRLTVTNSRSSMSWYIALLLCSAMIPGILGASKEGMLVPGVCWLVVVAASGHRFSRVGTIVLLGFVFLLWQYVFPFSQNARGPVREAERVSEKVDLIIDYFRNPNNFVDVRSNFDESYEFGAASAKVNILVRYSVLKSIDMLIGADDKLGYTPIERYTPVFVALVPHVIWPDRPEVITSNEVGHKAGFHISDADTTTGLEIGSPALFYDLGGWIALVVYSILSFSGFFFVTRRIVGAAEKGIWALVPIGSEVHLAAGASPASMFLLVSLFLGTFLIAIASLKIVSYVSQGLVSEPASFRP